MSESSNGGMPDVSVVIPCYRSATYVEATIDSALRQPEVLEVIAVDDGSPDNTLQVLRKIEADEPRVTVLAKENGGIASARNRGAEAVSPHANYIAFLDNDDLLVDGGIGALRRLLDDRPGCPVAHGLVELIDEDGRPSPEANWEVEEGRLAVSAGRSPLARHVTRLADEADTTIGAIGFRNPIATPGQALVRRDAYRRTDGFDADAVYCEDWDIWFSLARFDTFAFLPQTTLLYRRHPGGASQAQGRIRVTDKYLRRKWMDHGDLPAGYTRELRRAWIAYELVRIRRRAQMSLDDVKRRDVKEAARNALRVGSSVKELAVAVLSRRVRRA